MTFSNISHIPIQGHARSYRPHLQAHTPAATLLVPVKSNEILATDLSNAFNTRCAESSLVRWTQQAIRMAVTKMTFLLVDTQAALKDSPWFTTRSGIIRFKTVHQHMQVCVSVLLFADESSKVSEMKQYISVTTSHQNNDWVLEVCRSVRGAVLYCALLSEISGKPK